MPDSTPVTISSVLTVLTSVYDVIIGMFTNVISTITSNPLIFTPVLLALLGGVIMVALRIVRKFGIRGVSSRR